MRSWRQAVPGIALLAVTASVGAQGAAQPASPAAAAQPLPPATKLEAFKPAAGSVVTLGFEDMGQLAGISVDAREMRDGRGAAVRGLVVDVEEGQYRRARSFVDTDEIPELLKGFDALLDVKTNPTSFKSFEVRYTTRGGLQLTAFNMTDGRILYSVEAGRGYTASRNGLAEADMRRLRGMFEAAQQVLATKGGK